MWHPAPRPSRPWSAPGWSEYVLIVVYPEAIRDRSLSDDLTDPHIALGEAAHELDRGVVLLLDELSGRTSEQLLPTRSRLIDKGPLHTLRHEFAALTVPQFDRYLRRAYELRPNARARGKLA
jgi:hypothetical protein